MENKELYLEELGFKNVKKEDKKVFLALGADYGNIGDMGITIAQRELLSTSFPDYKLIEIPMYDAYLYEEDIKKILNDNDICTLIGGGNLGNVYFMWEERRRFIINLFKNNKIISFPQSINFEENEEGKKEFQNTINIYASHNNLTILSREQKSYNIMKNNFKNPVYLTPDVVFYLKEVLDKKVKNNKRENITLCFRDDGEKVIDEKSVQNLKNLLSKQVTNSVISMDTHIGNVSNIYPLKREVIFKDCLNKFYNSKVVITDRLHGLIFSIITNTPCIVFDNSNKKISSTYNTWLKDLPLIKLMDEYNEKEILKYIEDFSKINNPQIPLKNNISFDEIFKILK